MIVPSNMILNKLGKPSIYLPACMVIWGVISTATAATTSFRGLLVCRFFLGFVEAAYFVRLFIQTCHQVLYTYICNSQVVSTFCLRGTREKNSSKEPPFYTPGPYFLVHSPVWSPLVSPVVSMVPAVSLLGSGCSLLKDHLLLVPLAPAETRHNKD